MTMFSQPSFAAVPRRYAGVLFRSTLEARWAMLFDYLGIDWVWEPERYALPSGATYLPDFWLPQLDLHAEVKGTEHQWRLDEHRYNEAVLTGALPGQGLLVLGPIPSVIGEDMPYHPVVARDRGRPSGLCVHLALLDWLLADTGFACTDVDVLDRANAKHLGYQELVTLSYMRGYGVPSQHVTDAYDLARSARFEPTPARVAAVTRPVERPKTPPPPRSLYVELDAAKARAVALEKQIEEEADAAATADLEAGWCMDCNGTHLGCLAEDPDVEGLIEEVGEHLPGHFYDVAGDLIHDHPDLEEALVEAHHEHSHTDCWSCPECGCEGTTCSLSNKMKDD